MAAMEDEDVAARPSPPEEEEDEGEAEGATYFQKYKNARSPKNTTRVLDRTQSTPTPLPPMSPPKPGSISGWLRSRLGRDTGGGDGPGGGSGGGMGGTVAGWGDGKEREEERTCQKLLPTKERRGVVVPSAVPPPPPPPGRFSPRSFAGKAQADDAQYDGGPCNQSDTQECQPYTDTVHVTNLTPGSASQPCAEEEGKGEEEVCVSTCPPAPCSARRARWARCWAR
jgi:hypothetical protein